jgi:hypothetical protein
VKIWGCLDLLFSVRGTMCVCLSVPHGMRLSPLGSAATTGLLYQPQMIHDDECGPVGGMRIGRGNRSTRRKPAPGPLCPPDLGRRGEKPATNRLSYSKTHYVWAYYTEK